MPLFSRVALPNACTEIGTSCRLSSRLRAVTRISPSDTASPSSAVAAFCANPAAGQSIAAAVARRTYFLDRPDNISNSPRCSGAQTKPVVIVGIGFCANASESTLAIILYRNNNNSSPRYSYPAYTLVVFDAGQVRVAAFSLDELIHNSHMFEVRCCRRRH